MKREQQTHRPDDVLANAGDSLREWAPSGDEERVALDRVWNGLRWKANQVPAEVVHSVELGPALGERRRVEGPQAARWNRRSTVRAMAAAAMVIVAVGGAMVWPRGARVYAAGADGLQVTLADDSRVEMRAHSEMTVGRASDGIQIDLKTGDIIVNAARQRAGYLYVQTSDMTVALSGGAPRAEVDVVGTVFLVNAGTNGSRVGVIEGEVRVREGNVETRLRPGEQVATSRTVAQRPLTEDITWSRHAATHLAVLASFQKSITDTKGHLEALNQTAATAQGGATAFEEASVRPCDPDNLPANVPGSRGGGGANSVYMTPGRTHVLCMTLATLIRNAYGYVSVEAELQNIVTDPKAPARRRRPLGDGAVATFDVEDGRRVRGGPDWVRTTRYTIEAVANGSADAATMAGPMLLALLEQRFKLKAHVETEQVPALALVVAPGGLKIKPSAPDSCTPGRRVGAPSVAQMLLPNFPGRPTLSDVRRGQKPACGQALERNEPNLVLVAGGSTFSALAQVLGRRSEFVGPVRVYDKTGNTDTFDWILEFAPDENVLPALRAAGPSNVPRAPAIFVVLEQQLGLRLEPAQAPREFVVIDSIERPGPN